MQRTLHPALLKSIAGSLAFSAGKRLLRPGSRASAANGTEIMLLWYLLRQALGQVAG